MTGATLKKKFEGLDASRRAAVKELEKLGVKYEIVKGDIVVPGTIRLHQQDLTELPDLSCVVVRGSFYCHSNKLVSLKGAPKAVGQVFNCGINQLTSLEFSPQIVGGDFDCHDNQLTTLQYAPQIIGGDFICYDNPLTSLEGGPQQVGADYSAHYCNLSTLKGAPEQVGGDFVCFENPLEHLEHAPQKFKLLHSCHGKFNSLDDVPDNIRYSPETLERKATTLERPMAVRRPLALKMKFIPA